MYLLCFINGNQRRNLSGSVPPRWYFPYPLCRLQGLRISEDNLDCAFQPLKLRVTEIQTERATHFMWALNNQMVTAHPSSQHLPLGIGSLESTAFGCGVGDGNNTNPFLALCGATPSSVGTQRRKQTREEDNDQHFKGTGLQAAATEQDG